MKVLKIHTDFSEVVNQLTAEEAGRLFQALLSAAAGGPEPQLPGAERFVWALMKKDIERQQTSYGRKVEAAGEARKSNPRNNPVGSDDSRKIPAGSGSERRDINEERADHSTGQSTFISGEGNRSAERPDRSPGRRDISEELTDFSEGRGDLSSGLRNLKTERADHSAGRADISERQTDINEVLTDLREKQTDISSESTDISSERTVNILSGTDPKQFSADDCRNQFKSEKPSAKAEPGGSSGAAASVISNINNNHSVTTEEKPNEKECTGRRGEREQAVIDAWNGLGLAQVMRAAPSSSRGKMLGARLREYGTENVLRAIGNISVSSFLKGRNDRGWVISFDWFLRPENFLKVLEGQYNDRATRVQKYGYGKADDEFDPTEIDRAVISTGGSAAGPPEARRKDGTL